MNSRFCMNWSRCGYRKDVFSFRINIFYVSAVIYSATYFITSFWFSARILVRSDMISFLSDFFISSRLSRWTLGDLQGPAMGFYTCFFSVREVSITLETSSSTASPFWFLVVRIFFSDEKGKFRQEWILRRKDLHWRFPNDYYKGWTITWNFYMTLHIYTFPASFIPYPKIPRCHNNWFGSLKCLISFQSCVTKSGI